MNNLKTFKEKGYVIYRDIIPLKKIKQNISEIENLLKNQWSLYYPKIKYKDKNTAIIKLFNRNRFYRRYLYEWINKRLLTTTEFSKLKEVKNILKELNISYPVYQMSANRINLPEEDYFLTEWHQDIGVMDTLNSITLWMPLEKTTKKNGSISILSGSHKEGVIIPKNINYRGHSELNTKYLLRKYKEIWLTYNPGDLLVFHPMVVHNAKPNRSNKPRWALIFRFDDAEDQTYLNQEINPLKNGYIMKKSNTISGFRENKKNKKNKEIIKKYKSLNKN